MRRRILLHGLLAGFVMLASCSKPPPFKADNGVHEIMEHVLEPAAKVFWGGAGYVHNEQGERDLAPTTNEGWQALENAAAVIAESGNLLMMPGRAAPEVEWTTYSRRLAEVGLKGMKAAEARDKEAVFDVGGEIFEACEACHAKYLKEE